MYKLLIVDDEVIEREALKYIVKSNKLNIGQIEEASNGQEAVSVAALFHPDIVIMDIKMPGLNGIEAAKILKKIYNEIKIIFLTAFNEFEYAHEAIQLGVEDFIVKPAPNERTIQVISKAILQLDHIEMEKLQKKDMESKLSQITKYLEGEFVSSVVTGEIDEQQGRDYLTFMMSDFKSGFGVVISLDFYDSESITHLHKNMMKKRFLEKLTTNMNKKVHILLNHVRSSIYILVFGYPEKHKELYAKMINEEIHCIKDDFGDQLQASVGVGIGDEYSSVSELWKSFSQAKVTCKNERMILLDENNLEGVTVANALDLKEKELCESIVNGNEQEMVRIIDDILDNIIYTCHDINIVRLKMYEFIILLNRTLNKDSNRHNTVPERLFNDLKTVESKGEAKIYIHEYFLKILVDIHLTKTDKTGLIIDKAIKYIQLHYAENLTLEDVAFTSGFSSYYFCKMFKKYYGCSFTDYLSGIRIQKAKSYLKDPHMNIKEITQLIGYEDPNYFTRVFKKYEGITPSEYRNKIFLID